MKTEIATYDTVMQGITQPVLDSWCRVCMKFGHLNSHTVETK